MRLEKISLLYFSTSNFDDMRKFLVDFGFEVTENPNDKLMPAFNDGRAVRAIRGDLDFTLEESTTGVQRASFNVMLTGYSDEEIERIKALGYECDSQRSIYGTSHSFRTPDGGTFVL